MFVSVFFFLFWDPYHGRSRMVTVIFPFCFLLVIYHFSDSLGVSFMPLIYFSLSSYGQESIGQELR